MIGVIFVRILPVGRMHGGYAKNDPDITLIERINLHGKAIDIMQVLHLVKTSTATDDGNIAKKNRELLAPGSNSRLMTLGLAALPGKQGFETEVRLKIEPWLRGSPRSAFLWE